jgi:hypothetical protein
MFIPHRTEALGGKESFPNGKHMRGWMLNKIDSHSYHGVWKN